MRRITCTALALLAFTLLVSACGAEEGAKPAGPAPTVPPPASEPETTPAPAETSGGETTPPSAPKRCVPESGGEDGVYTNLVAVRVGSHAGYDRITFEFEAPEPNPGGAAGIPRYEIRTVKPPLVQDPSGLPLAVQGDVFVSVVFHGASGHDFEGHETYTGSKRIRTGFDTLVEAVESGDFEATLGWVLGLDRPACWEAHEFHNPERVAIDIPHA